jgi:hypothetical protein
MAPECREVVAAVQNGLPEKKSQLAGVMTVGAGNESGAKVVPLADTISGSAGTL